MSADGQMISDIAMGHPGTMVGTKPDVEKGGRILGKN